jgi:hypothetical protein
MIRDIVDTEDSKVTESDVSCILLFQLGLNLFVPSSE